MKLLSTRKSLTGNIDFRRSDTKICTKIRTALIEAMLLQRKDGYREPSFLFFYRKNKRTIKNA